MCEVQESRPNRLVERAQKGLSVQGLYRSFNFFLNEIDFRKLYQIIFEFLYVHEMHSHSETTENNGCPGSIETTTGGGRQNVPEWTGFIFIYGREKF